MLRKSLQTCKLELHPQKTKIVYCQDWDRTDNYVNTKFDFLGYTFGKVLLRDKLGRLQVNFIASVSSKARQNLRDKIKAMELHKRTEITVNMLAEQINPIVRGWINYFSLSFTWVSMLSEIFLKNGW